MDQRITVLIPNYNGANFLPDLFQSLQCQSKRDFKCIFLDDGSTDNSVEIASGFQQSLERLEVLTLENVGIGANWNRGIELVDTEFFSVLHCDDLYEPDYLMAMLDLMDQYPLAALGHCGAITIDEQSRVKSSLIEDYKHQRYLPDKAFRRNATDEFNCLLSGDFINCPSVMYRTSAVKQIGLFNVQLKQVLDWEYWFRTILNGYEICGTNHKLYRYRRHDNNATVQNSEDFARYLEELNLLRWAHQEGINHGLVSKPLDTSIVRNIVVLDIGEALSLQNRQAASQKVGFLEEHRLAGSTVIGLLRAMVIAGRLGGVTVKSAIGLYIRLSAVIHRTG
ncbi:MAG: glycosyltransferase family 2 protein [bacterium]|nr:glycosyltransferase [Gammaproteobacteria bacterium]HIL96529.1 glycosyltransferase [Pseudomonadales bacterium]